MRRQARGRMTRVYHPFWLWEDIGMWRNVSASDARDFLSTAIDFTGNAAKYGAAMLRVLDEFPIACEHNLTDEAQNRQAWIGHAACYLAFACPEDIVREAWGQLTQRQRDEANAVADLAIAKWEAWHAKKNSSLYPQMEIAGLPG